MKRNRARYAQFSFPSVVIFSSFREHLQLLKSGRECSWFQSFVSSPRYTLEGDGSVVNMRLCSTTITTNDGIENSASKNK